MESLRSEIEIELSVIVVCYNMEREIMRTLYSLSAAFQQGVEEESYEVIVIDNHSATPLDGAVVHQFGENFSYHYFNSDSKSPAGAVNLGVSRARADNIACIVDGARIASPGIVHFSLLAKRLFPNSFILSLAWHLGPQVQNESVARGYNQHTEDRLLQDIDWTANGYKLFSISTLAPSSAGGFMGRLPEECSYFAISKSDFIKTGGFDERFQSPGGGLVNHDFLQRTINALPAELVVLLGEGTFHQVHGGVATNADPHNHPWESFADEWQRIHNKPFESLKSPTADRIHYLGMLDQYSLPFVSKGDV